MKHQSEDLWFQKDEITHHYTAIVSDCSSEIFRSKCTAMSELLYHQSDTSVYCHGE